jgi:OPT family small oligopeptide transporter
MALSGFGAALATIFLFKPQSMAVSVIFLTVISYVAGHAMSVTIPTKGLIGRLFNPHTFNSKEHLAIVVMASSASGAALATEVLAAQKLYYNVVPNTAVAIMLLLSSQLLGYGMAGVLRKSLVYPTKMLWPLVLPLNSLIETLHRDRKEVKFNFFWIVFGITAVWEIFPQYVMPILTGVSIFCLANRDSLVFTNIFGGTSGNEGLGVLSVGLDWQYITTSSLSLPLVTLTNGFVGFISCILLFIGLYYGNVWRAQDFPFLSQLLFSQSSNSTTFVVYNQTAILDANQELDPALLDAIGLPFFTATTASYILTTNLSIGATILHVLLFNFNAIKDMFQLPKWANIRGRGHYAPLSEEMGELDPHYRKMLAYAEVPSWWYILVGLLSVATGLASTYILKSTLPWWGFLIACTLSFLSTLFFGAMGGLIGFHVPITSVIQLIGGYLHPGKPVANMYFVLFGANSQRQAIFLIENLKMGQYGKLSPRCTFTVQIIGTIFGAIINYILMSSITTNQREVLLSIQGTNIWSGQVIQSFNSYVSHSLSYIDRDSCESLTLHAQAIAFGALSTYMFSNGRTYQWIVFALPIGFLVPLPLYLLHRRWPSVGFDNIITPVICWCLGYLSVGINSSTTLFFAVGFFSQFYVRKRYPQWFLKYNYILAAAISGGTELLVFISTFAVQGATGEAIPFPPYWGNNYQKGNFDYCAKNPALGGDI